MKNLIIVILLGISVSLLSGCVSYYVPTPSAGVTDSRGRNVSVTNDGCEKTMTTYRNGLPHEIIAEYRRGCEPHGLRRIEEEYNRNFDIKKRHNFYYGGKEEIISYRTRFPRKGKMSSIKSRPNSHSRWETTRFDKWGEPESWRRH